MTSSDTLQQMQAENERLRREVARYRSIFQQLPLGIYVYHLEDINDDRTLRMADANPVVEQLAGLPPEQIIGKTLDENFPGLREQGLPQAFAGVVRSGEGFEAESIYGDDNVVESAWNVIAVPLPDQHVSVMFDNITLRKQAEQEVRRLNTELEQRVNERTAALQRNQALLRGILENSPSAIYVKDLEGRFLLANENTAVLMHLSADELVGKVDSELFPPEYVDHWRANEQQVLDQRQAIEIEETAPMEDGIHTFLSYRIPIYDENGTIYATGGISTDVTQRKRSEEDLKLFQAIAENAPDAIAIARIDTSQITYANRSYREMLGVDDEVIGTSMINSYAETAETMNTVIQEALAQNTWRGTLTYKRSDGTTFPGQLSGLVLRDANGQPYAIAGIVRDLSEQRQAEAERATLQEQVIDAQRAALRELSTPLIPISDNVVIMPLIGTIDSARAQMVMEALLEGVALYQAETVILDITGVQIVDTQVADAFIRAAQAVRLLGASVMMTGIQPQIAQTLVQLGVDLSEIQTHGSLQSGIAQALHIK